MCMCVGSDHKMQDKVGVCVCVCMYAGSDHKMQETVGMCVCVCVCASMCVCSRF